MSWFTKDEARSSYSEWVKGSGDDSTRPKSNLYTHIDDNLAITHSNEPMRTTHIAQELMDVTEDELESFDTALETMQPILPRTSGKISDMHLGNKYGINSSLICIIPKYDCYIIGPNIGMQKFINGISLELLDTLANLQASDNTPFIRLDTHLTNCLTRVNRLFSFLVYEGLDQLITLYSKAHSKPMDEDTITSVTGLTYSFMQILEELKMANTSDITPQLKPVTSEDVTMALKEITANWHFYDDIGDMILEFIEKYQTAIAISAKLARHMKQDTSFDDRTIVAFNLLADAVTRASNRVNDLFVINNSIIIGFEEMFEKYPSILQLTVSRA